MHKKVKPNGLQKLNKEQQKLIIYADTAILTIQKYQEYDTIHRKNLPKLYSFPQKGLMQT